MKKKLLLLLMVTAFTNILICCTRSHREQMSANEVHPKEVSNCNDISEEQLAFIKTVTAWHVNKLSLPDQFVENECPSGMNINEIKQKVNGIAKNEQLTAFIEKSNPGSMTGWKVYDFYTKDIFSDETFNEYFSNDITRRTRLEDVLNKELAKVIRNSNSDNGRNKVSGAGTKEIKPDSAKKNTINFLSVMNFALSILAIAAAFYLFMEMNKQKCDVQSKDQCRKEQLIGLEKKLAQLNDDLTKSKSQITEMKKQMAENGDIVRGMKRFSASMNGNVDMTVEKQPAVKHEIKVNEFYAGVPTSGYFKVSDSYSTKALYKIIAQGDSIGEFEFINRSEAVETAKMSKTSFLDPACNIVNDEVMSFNRIITEHKGMVERTDNGWKITKKASIRLV